jgi:hypothetical protein
MPQAVINPKVFILDLDESLFEVTIKNSEKKESLLTDSAKLALSQDDHGVLKNCPIMEYETGQFYYAESVVAINREKIKKFLDQVLDIIQDAKNAGLTAPVKVIVMTSASYTEHEIKAIFDHFYSDGDKRFTSGDFPIKFYNKFSFEDTFGYEIYESWNLKKYREADYHSEHNIRNKRTKTASVYEPQKALIAAHHFPDWQAEMSKNPHCKPLERKDVCFFDDTEYNLEPVRHAGFKDYGNGANKKYRDPDDKFRHAFDRSINAFMDMLSAIQQGLIDSTDIDNPPTESVLPIDVPENHQDIINSLAQQKEELNGVDINHSMGLSKEPEVYHQETLDSLGQPEEKNNEDEHKFNNLNDFLSQAKMSKPSFFKSSRIARKLAKEIPRTYDTTKDYEEVFSYVRKYCKQLEESHSILGKDKALAVKLRQIIGEGPKKSLELLTSM